MKSHIKNDENNSKLDLLAILKCRWHRQVEFSPTKLIQCLVIKYNVILFNLQTKKKKPLD